MKAQYKVDTHTIIEIESDQLTDVLRELQDVKNCISKEPCGKCNGDNSQWRVRRSGDYEFFEIYCPDCYAVLSLGQHKTGDEKGKLYKKRMKTNNKGQSIKDDEGKGIPLPDRGWQRWNKETQQLE